MTIDAPDSSIQAIFLGWSGPALPNAAKLLADEYLGSDGLDLRGVVVVTPAARAGRRLAELLLDQAEARGVPFTPPRTVTMGRFPELLYQPTGPLADPITSRHAFAQALQGVDVRSLEKVFPHRPPGLSGWMTLAGIVESLHRELGAEGLDFRAVSRRFREGPRFDFDDSSRWEGLAKVQDAYLEILKGSGLRDRDLERKRAMEEGHLSSPGEVWMVGVVELPRIAKEMVSVLPGPIRTLIHAPLELRDGFDTLGCVRSDGVDGSGNVVPGPWRTAGIDLENEKIHVVRRPRDQAAATAGVLRGFEARFAPEEVVVGVPDPELVPLVEQGLSAAGVRHRFAGGTLLSDTGPVRLLQALAAYMAGRPYPAFGALIRHPDLFGIVEKAGADDAGSPEEREAKEALTAVDRFQSKHLQNSVEGPLPGSDRRARRTRALVNDLERALGLETFTGTRRISQWMPDVLEILVRVYAGESLDRSSPRGRHLVEAFDRIKSAAARLANLPPGLDVEVEAPDSLTLLLAELTGPEQKIPPDPEEHAVELLGWLELPLDDAPAVILTGLNDRILPEAMGADPFLPGSLRSYLGLPDDGARYARDAYLLSALVESREEVHLVAGRHTTDGDPLRPSRLLFAASPQEVARRIKRYWGDSGGEGEGVGIEAEGSEAGDVPGKRGIAGDPARSRFRSPPEDPIRALGSLESIRVTDFSAYLADPYRYALTRVLGLEPLDDAAREMDGMCFGTLAHEVLEEFGDSEESRSADAGAVMKKLGRLLDQAVRETFGHGPVPAVRVQIEQLRTRLRRFSQWQADWVRDGWKTVSVEAPPKAGVPFEVDGEVVLLRGKIDRIDHNPVTGEWAIFDYKTGDAGTDPEKAHRKGRGANKEWVDLQLPLYRHLLPGVLGKDRLPVVPPAARDDVKLGYILLPRNLDRVGPSFANWSAADLAEAEETARRVIRELKSNEFHYDPRSRSFRDDPFDALLGRLELPRDGDEDGDGDEGGET